MGKVEEHKQDLHVLFAEEGELEAARVYLLDNSNLPGRRANLELARAFAEVIGARPEFLDRGWELSLDLIALSAEVAPVDSADEFLPFCGALGIGTLGAVSSPRFVEALILLRRLSGDPRWRLREAVAQGLQRLLAARWRETYTALTDWVAAGDFLEMRAAAAAVAESSLLADSKLAREALALHQAIVVNIRESPDRRSDAFRTLRKGLAYTISVVVAALPDKGFAWISTLVDSGDRDLRWVVKQNLNKNRLIKGYPQQVAAIQDRIS
jgi:hypothetical protein